MTRVSPAEQAPGVPGLQATIARLDAELRQTKQAISRIRREGTGGGTQGPPGDDGLPGAPGVDGADGEDGRTIWNGAGAPSSGLGADGDFYIDTAADAIYGPKVGAAWGSPTSLIGPAGADGADGEQGDEGDVGPAGPPGEGPPLFADAAARDAAIPSPVGGQMVVIDQNLQIYENLGLGGWVQYDTIWTTYTPTLTNITLGAGGTNVGRYKRDGIMCDVEVHITLGTTPTWASPTFSLPFAGADPQSEFGNGQPWGHGFIRDIGTSANNGLIIVVPADSAPVAAVLAQYQNAAGTALINATISSTVPFTPAVGDKIIFHCRFQLDDPYV